MSLAAHKRKHGLHIIAKGLSVIAMFVLKQLYRHPYRNYAMFNRLFIVQYFIDVGLGAYANGYTEQVKGHVPTRPI